MNDNMENQTNQMLLLEVRNDVKAISKDISEIKILDAVQNKHLQDHMRRTELNEKRLTKLESYQIFFAFLAMALAAYMKFF